MMKFKLNKNPVTLTMAVMGKKKDRAMRPTYIYVCNVNVASGVNMFVMYFFGRKYISFSSTNRSPVSALPKITGN